MKPRLKKLAIWSAILFFFIIIKPAYIKLSAPKHIKDFNQEQALQDYDYMWEYLEDNFPLFGVAQRKHGADKDEIKDRYRSKILKTSHIRIENFYEILSDCISEFKGTGHLAIFDPNAFYMVHEQLNYFDSQGYDIYYALGEIKWKKSHSTYDYLQKTQSNLKLKTNPMSNKNVTTKIIDENTAYLKVVNFLEDHLKEDQEIIFEFYRSIADKENLIIDVRRYQGGSDHYWMENIISPNITQAIGYDNLTLLMGGSLNKELMAKGILHDLNTDFTQVSMLPNINQDDLKLMDYWFTRRHEIEPLGTEKMFNGNIYVLVDHTVSSSTEAFVQFCKQTGFAKLVGTNSRGDGAAGLNPIAKSLPNSGIVFWSRVVYGLNPDGSSNAEYGTQPDYYANKNEDVLDACLRVIDENS